MQTTNDLFNLFFWEYDVQSLISGHLKIKNWETIIIYLCVVQNAKNWKIPKQDNNTLGKFFELFGFHKPQIISFEF